MRRCPGPSGADPSAGPPAGPPAVSSAVPEADPSLRVVSDILVGVPEDPVTEPDRDRGGAEAKRRRLAVIAAGHRGEAPVAREALADGTPSVRAAALGALARCGALGPARAREALGDPDPLVRRRSADLAAEVAPDAALDAALGTALGDPDPLVVEAACWALGEREATSAVPALAAVAVDHPDPRCREAAVAALGALGDPAGLAAVLHALDDRPSVRRRATVALAAFEGPAVDEALRRSAVDRDWQVREVAEILLGAV